MPLLVAFSFSRSFSTSGSSLVGVVVETMVVVVVSSGSDDRSSRSSRSYVVVSSWKLVANG